MSSLLAPNWDKSKGPSQLQISQYGWLCLCCNCNKVRLLHLPNLASCIPSQVLILRVFSNRLLHVNPTNLHLCSPGCPACDSDRLISVLTIQIFLIIRKSRLQHCSVDFLTKCSYHRMEHPVTQTSSAAICLLVLLSLL